MLKNRIVSAFVLTGLVGVAACGGQEETRIETETPAIEAPATTPAPTVETDPTMDPTMDPALQDTMYQDTMGVGTMPEDDGTM